MSALFMPDIEAISLKSDTCTPSEIRIKIRIKIWKTRPQKEMPQKEMHPQHDVRWQFNCQSAAGKAGWRA
jgi:hypothetical protein